MKKSRKTSCMKKTLSWVKPKLEVFKVLIKNVPRNVTFSSGHDSIF